MKDEKSAFLPTPQQKRLHRLPWGLLVLVIVYLGTFMITTQDNETSRNQSFIKTFDENYRRKRETNYDFTTVSNEETTTNKSLWTTTTPEKTKRESQGIYPPDYFNFDMRRKGILKFDFLII